MNEPHGNASPASITVMAAFSILLGGIAGAATYTQDVFIPEGAALVSVAVAIFGFTAVEAAKQRWPSLAVAGAVVSLLLTGAAVQWFRDDAPPGVAGMEGGCEPFTVFAQNRWAPVGAAVRAQPWKSANKVGSYAGNELVTLDGWVRTAPAYPHNPPPFDSEVWFHVADDSGWVSFAGVRADSTPLDQTGLDDRGGRPVPVTERCSAVVRD